MTSTPDLMQADALASSSSSSVRTGGTLLVLAGVTGALAGVLLAAWPRETTPDQFTYPLGTTSHVVFQTFFAVHHLGLVAGVLALARVARGCTRGVRVGLVVAVVGLVLLTLMEAITAWAGLGIAVDSDRGGVIGAGYGVASLLTGVGLVVAGTGLLRRPVMDGAGRWLPLALGIWVFVPMVPALFAPMVWGRLAIIGWMLLFTALGLRLRRVGDDG